MLMQRCSDQTLRAILERQSDLFLRSNDHVLVICDRNLDNLLCSVFASYSPRIKQLPPIEKPGCTYDIYPDELKGITIAFLITGASLTYATATRLMKESGIFVVNDASPIREWLPLLSDENLVSCRSNAVSILKALGGNGGGDVQITSSDGTDLYLRVGIDWKQEVGKRDGARMSCGVFGELSNVPFTTRGTYYLNPGDFLGGIGKLTERIALGIRDNVVTSIEGGFQSDQLRLLLNGAKNPLAFHLGELSLGLNPAKPRSIPTTMIAEKLTGSVHIAMGTPLRVDPNVLERRLYDLINYQAGIHVDAVKHGATVTIHRFGSTLPTTIISDGRLIV